MVTIYLRAGYKEIHMPNNSGVPFIMAVFFFIFGFAFVFSMWITAIASLIGIFACLIHRSFEKDHGYHISGDELKKTEIELRGAK